MRPTILAGAVLMWLCVLIVPIQAGQRGQGASHASSTPHTQAPTSHGPTSHGPTSHGPTSHGPTSHGPTSHGPTTSGPADKGPASHSSPKASSTTTTTTTTTPTTPTTTTPDFTSGPVARLLTQNTTLTSKLETRLTALGYTGGVYQAAYGFKNLGQFIAATNVSQNLGIPFEQLKLQMTGLSVAPDGTVTQSDMQTQSLGQAIHSIDGSVDATAAANTATDEADREISR
jgi:hypothetical protein